MTQVAPQPARRDRRDDGYHPGTHAAGPGSGPPEGVAARPGRLRGRHATGYDQGFGGLVLWTLIGSLVPGAGFIAAGRRVPGYFFATITGLLLAGLAAFAVFGDKVGFALRLATSVTQLLVLAVASCVAALVWGLLVLSSHRALRRFTALTGLQAALSSALVIALVAGGGLLAYGAASSALITRDTLATLGKNAPARVKDTAAPKNDAADPWADTPRVNVLLIGSDKGADRQGIRTDSTILASIDTHTGNTVLLGIPRNMERIPFPENSPGARQYPDGFDCQDPSGVSQCLFNALWQYGVEHASDPYYKNSPWKDPGLQATVDGVKAVTGLPVDDYVILDMAGFSRFVNAIGGVVVTVHNAIPVAGHEAGNPPRQVGVKYYIQPGRKRLMGYEAMWFARSRSNSSDFDRMARQRCMIGAITSQADPVTLARAFPDLAAIIKDDLRMSIPLDDLSSWVTLALRVKSAKVTSLPFTPLNVNVVRPDFDRIHQLVQDALKASGTPTTKKKKKKPTSGSTPTDPNKAVDVSQVC